MGILNDSTKSRAVIETLEKALVLAEKVNEYESRRDLSLSFVEDFKVDFPTVATKYQKRANRSETFIKAWKVEFEKQMNQVLTQMKAV